MSSFSDPLFSGACGLNSKAFWPQALFLTYGNQADSSCHRLYCGIAGWLEKPPASIVLSGVYYSDNCSREITMHVDSQQIIALSIVTLAALSVGRRLWSQIAGFRGKSSGTEHGAGCSGCDSCPSSGNSVMTPLIQIASRPPKILRRPPGSGA